MKRFIIVLVLGVFFVPGLVSAQAPTGVADSATTRILAIGSVTAPLTTEERKIILPREVKATVELYLQGKIDQWWFRQDGKGVVFLLNVSSADAAESMLEKLPLGVARRMKFDYIPVGPLKPLRYLLADH